LGRFWPSSDIEPFASFINGVQKFVVTSTPPEQDWPETRFIEDGLAAFVGELKQQPGGDIGIHASISVAQSLLAAGLVDELRLVVAPAVQMHGRRLFDNGIPRRLSLTRSVTSPSGYLLLDYHLG
jgi:dihydrofolate reductase